MGIGPFSTYAPPGVYTQTNVEPIVGTLLTGIRVPVFIGTGNESLFQSGFEMVRGSSSSADTPIFGEDTSNRWVLGGTNERPVLGACNGNTLRFKVRNYPIVDGTGSGRATYDSGKVSVLVNGSEAAVAAVDGPNGIVTLLVPPSPNDFVTVNYYFRRKDTQITDDVSYQVTTSVATINVPVSGTYNIPSGSNVLKVKVNDSVTASEITLTTGSARLPTDLVSDINGKVSGLSAFVSTDIQGNSRVTLLADGNLVIGDGSVNPFLGFSRSGGETSNPPRNKTFYVFNGPVVDGKDSGTTTNSPASVVVTVNGAAVIPTEVNGAARRVVLPVAPTPGSIVLIRYYFNTWQDTFDYLPNSNVTSVVRVGITPSTSDYTSGSDFVILNDGDQSKIMWGAAYTITTGATVGNNDFGTSQISARLVDNRIFGVPAARRSDSLVEFALPYIPTTGNGRDTSLTTSIYNAVTNGRMDLPTVNPTLITAYVGKTWRDAYAKGPVAVREVNGAIITMEDEVSPDYNVFVTFWHSILAKDTYTLTVVSSGQTGAGQYNVTSALTGTQLFGGRFGTKTGVAQTLQWPSGFETQPDITFSGEGVPVSETVTVTFDDELAPATNASITSRGNSPYEIYSASSIFGDIIVDGNTQSVNLDTAYKAIVVGQPTAEPLAFASTDRLFLNIDGTEFVVDVSGETDMAGVASAINLEVGSSVASVLSYGLSDKILMIEGVNSAPSHNGGTSSYVQVMSSTDLNQTSGALKMGLSDLQESTGSWTGINKAARLVGTKTAPFTFDGSNNALRIGLDGNQFTTNFNSGLISAQSTVNAINDAFVAAALTSTAQNDDLKQSVTDLANSLAAKFSAGGAPSDAHIHNTDFHVADDTVNDITATYPASVVSGSIDEAVALLNDLKAVFNAHREQSGIHLTDDTTNVVTAADCTDLATALVLAHAIQDAFNAHLTNFGSHGHDDTANHVTLNTSSADISTVTYPGGVGTAIVITTVANHGFSNGDYVNISGVTGIVPSINGSHVVANKTNNTFEIGINYTSGSAVLTSAVLKDSISTYAVINSIVTDYNNHRDEAGVHLTDDTTNVVSGTATSVASAITVLTDIKSKFNAHIADMSFHVRNDTANVITETAPSGTGTSGFTSVLNFTEAVAYKVGATEFGHYNAHLSQVISSIHVHGTSAILNEVTDTTTGLVAFVGVNDEVDQIIVESLVNTNASNVTALSSSALATIGFTSNQSASREQPSGASMATQLMNDSGFTDLAVAYPVVVPGFGGDFLRIDSLTQSATSSLRFSPASGSCFVQGTLLGIDATTLDYGEDAVAGFMVSSSDTAAGSSGIGLPGQTYTDSRTGLRFSLLPPVTGNYSNGGKFTMFVGNTILCDSAAPSNVIPGLELTVTNTVGVEPLSTAIVNTYASGGKEPANGSVYYATYYYGKTDYSTQLFTDLKKIQATYGDPTPDYPLSLASRLAILNGAVLIGLKQVKKSANVATAPTASYLTAIEELQKPLSGNIKPDIITPLTPDPVVFAALNQHCLFMSAPRQEGERTGVVGVGIGTTPTGVSAIAKGISSELMTVVYPDSFLVTVSDSLGNTSTRLVDGTYMAAALAASTCSPAIDVATPWTRRTINGFRSVGRVMDPTEANQVAVSGVTVIEQLDTGVRVRHGLTTRIDNVITRTPSVQLTIQYVQQQIRAALDPFIGQKFTSTIPRQVETTVSAMFQNLISAAIVNKVAGISATVDANDPTVLRLEAIYVPVFPLEYIVAVLSIRIRA
jgi:hypothetical protein